ncbi:MAG TPA: helix-turn-helix domain-containing protein [Actinomycetota bacterium]|nr:helix-turn-helix domain-containing protein [Actinomycetota bacterium]
MNSNPGVRERAPQVAKENEATPLEAAVARIGDRWSLLLIDALLGGAHRFNELTAELPGIAPNVLSQRLKHLEREGVVVAHPYSHRPLRFRYELTGAGRDLAGALRLLEHWGARGSDSVDPPRHDLCGTPVEPRWYCPTCARTVDEHENASDLRFF